MHDLESERMSTLEKLPWISFALLLITYIILGWLLSALHERWYVWLMVAVVVLLIIALLSTPWSKIRNSFIGLLKSDGRIFFSAIAIASLSFAIVCMLHIFSYALIVIAVNILARLDAQTSGLSARQAFWILAILSLAGLELGAVAQTVIPLPVV